MGLRLCVARPRLQVALVPLLVAVYGWRVALAAYACQVNLFLCTAVVVLAPVVGQHLS